MASHRYLTCLFLLTASLTDLSKAACNDYFTRSAWKDNLTDELDDFYFIQIDRDPESIMKCSVKNTILQSCFEKTNAACEGESPNKMAVPFYHSMCLADIARTDREKSKPTPEDVCKVYEKVCRPFVKPSSTPEKVCQPCVKPSSTPAPPATTTSVPSTTPTIVGTTPTKITSVSPSTPAMPTSTSSTTTTVQPATAMAVSSTAQPITSTTPIKTTAASPTAPTTVTEQQSAQTASARRDQRTGDPNETVLFKLLIPFLIFTNIACPLAVYMFMRRQRNKETFKKVNQNMLDEGQTTTNQQNAVIQIKDNEEDAILLESSSIINAPETMQTESPRQNALEH